MKLPLIDSASNSTNSAASGAPLSDMRATSLRLVVIANACQTVDETLSAYRLNASDAELLERNNEYYLERYRAMIPTVVGERREIVDAVNAVRRARGRDDLINEHNSYALNGIYMYSFLSQIGYAGRVDLVDNIDMEPERSRALVEKADVVIFSTTFITSADTIVRVAKVVKSWNPEVKVVAGGAKLTQFVDDSEIEEAARACDALVLSTNGERTLVELLQRFDSNRPWDDLPNLALNTSGFFKTTKANDGVDINQFYVRWDELPHEFLRSAVNVRTGRGCPFKCKFCTFPSYNDQQMDLKSIPMLLDELRLILKRPEIKTVRFVDDTLFLSKEHLKEVCQALIDMNFDRPWTCYLRASTLTDECARYLRDAGCKLVLVGVESCDDTVLKNMSKGIREQHNWQAAENLAKYGILGFAFILNGFPGETQQSIDKTIHFLNNAGMHAYVHSPLFIFPKSPVSLEAQKYSLQGGFNDWRHDTMTCREAIMSCARMFEEVTAAAYIDRGSSITKVLLDHHYSVDEVKELGRLHNQLAREEIAGARSPATEAAFETMALRHADDANGRKVADFTSPYSRTGGKLQVNAGARF
ncbi:B12-binding domain-containing radical SAM protein [Haliangium sp.]|uniref:B12-binding domain-containing radical SAM protein n=1 Tax=Haliangium sp. TaxID=2663208 RepID=UPI003D0FFABF